MPSLGPVDLFCCFIVYIYILVNENFVVGSLIFLIGGVFLVN